VCGKLRDMVRLLVRLTSVWPRLSWRTGRRVLLILLALAFALYVAHVVGPNTHTVIPGKLYRSAQPTPAGLASQIERHGIRTVVNLRGYCPLPKDQWYRDETTTIATAGISQEDITLSALQLPYPAELRRLVEVFDGGEYPMLIHCKQGADRTGLVAALALLLYTDASLTRARLELLPHRGHVRFGRTAAMDEFFDRYEAWLGERPHTPGLLRDWILNHYKPGRAVGTLESTTPQATGTPSRWLAIPVRVTNQSDEPWQFQTGPYAGVHVGFTVMALDGTPVKTGQAGLLRHTLVPGGQLALTLAVPPLRQPGEYVLRADLIDATAAGVPVRMSSFAKYGTETLVIPIRITEEPR
jgi:protein tyrosine phosphatase (PTP) superfamily phosphohydrolase (DUF442 family)